MTDVQERKIQKKRVNNKINIKVGLRTNRWQRSRYKELWISLHIYFSFTCFVPFKVCFSSSDNDNITLNIINNKQY